MDLREIVSGVTAGAVTTLVVHPLDLVKVRLQLAKKTCGYREAILGGDKRLHGLRSFYRGVCVNLLGNTVAWGCYFGLYRYAKDWCMMNMQSPAALQYLVAGTMSGFATTVLTNPLWVLKTRIMSTTGNSNMRYDTLREGLQRIWTQEGPKALWKGLTPALFGVSQGALYFTIYDSCKARIVRDRTDQRLRNVETVAITTLSKMISTSIVYPFQLIKSHMQSFKNVSGALSFTTVWIRSYQIEGVLGLYKGLSANLFRSIPSTCITFAVYENLKHIL